MNEEQPAPAAAPWPRPRVVASACLETLPCRFNGQAVRARFVPRLAEFVDLVTVCPEVEIGLGIPRPAIRLVSLGGSTRLVQPATGRDVTEAMEHFAQRFLDGLGEVDGFLLKSRSPSCGPRDVRVYSAAGAPGHDREPGRFAAAVSARYPAAAVEDEGRLTNYRLRNHFLTRLFLAARLRELPVTARSLGAFHADNKLLLLAHSEAGMRELGRVVANASGLPAAEVRRRYAEGFARALALPPRVGPLVNALMHAFGHVTDALVPAEKRLFAEILEGVQAGRTSLEAPTALIRAWVARYEVAWLAGQTLFQPYPAALHDLADSAGESRAA